MFVCCRCFIPRRKESAVPAGHDGKKLMVNPNNSDIPIPQTRVPVETTKASDLHLTVA